MGCADALQTSAAASNQDPKRNDRLKFILTSDAKTQNTFAAEIECHSPW
jgi:hypothetical protein